MSHHKNLITSHMLYCSSLGPIIRMMIKAFVAVIFSGPLSFMAWYLYGKVARHCKRLWNHLSEE